MKKKVTGIVLHTTLLSLELIAFLVVSGSLVLSSWAYLIRGQWFWFI